MTDLSDTSPRARKTRAGTGRAFGSVTADAPDNYQIPRSFWTSKLVIQVGKFVGANTRSLRNLLYQHRRAWHYALERKMNNGLPSSMQDKDRLASLAKPTERAQKFPDLIGLIPRYFSKSNNEEDDDGDDDGGDEDRVQQTEKLCTYLPILAHATTALLPTHQNSFEIFAPVTQYSKLLGQTSQSCCPKSYLLKYLYGTSKFCGKVDSERKVARETFR